MKNEVGFFHVDKHQSFPQVDTIFFDGFGQPYLKYPHKFAISLQHLKKEVRNILIFRMCTDSLVIGVIFFICQLKTNSNGRKYSGMVQVKFVEDSFLKISRDIVRLSRPYPLKFFNGCLPQILLGPFLNTFSRMISFIFEKWS